MATVIPITPLGALPPRASGVPDGLCAGEADQSEDGAQRDPVPEMISRHHPPPVFQRDLTTMGPG